MATLKDVKVHLERTIPGIADNITLLDAINIALVEVGKITQIDDTLVVVNNQTEYDLPSGVSDVVRVQIANGDTADYDFTTIYNWREVNDDLVFPNELPFDAGNTIRIFYNDAHDSVDDDTDTIDDAIPLPMLYAIARYFYEFLRYQDQSNMSIKDEKILELLNNQMFTAMQLYRVRKLYRDPILGELGETL